MALGHQQGQVFMGRDFHAQPDYSDEIAFQIDKEMEAHRGRVLRHRRGPPGARRPSEKLSKELIEVETVDANHLMRLIEEYAVDEIQVDGPSQRPPGRPPGVDARH